MSRAICRLCAQVNPEGARFCNECGSPLTLVACPECEAINGLDAAHCHQCGASLDAHEEEVGAAISASNATSVPTPPPQSGPLLQGTSGDRTPIALAQRFEGGHAAPGRSPSPRRADERPAVAVPIEPARPENERGVGQHAIIEEPVDLRAGERTPPVRGTRQRRVPPAMVALVVIVIAAGGYYGWINATRFGWINATRSDVAATPTSPTQQTSPDNAELPATPAPSPAAPANEAVPPRAATANETATPPVATTNETATPPAATRNETATPPAATVNETARSSISTPQQPATPPGEVTASPPPTAPTASASAPPPSSTRARVQPPASSLAKERAATPSPRPTTSSSSERQASRARPARREPKVDRDALATERLIERDLGKFLPRSDTNGSAQ